MCVVHRCHELDQSTDAKPSVCFFTKGRLYIKTLDVPVPGL